MISDDRNPWFRRNRRSRRPFLSLVNCDTKKILPMWGGQCWSLCGLEIFLLGDPHDGLAWFFVFFNLINSVKKRTLGGVTVCYLGQERERGRERGKPQRGHTHAHADKHWHTQARSIHARIHTQMTISVAALGMLQVATDSYRDRYIGHWLCNFCNYFLILSVAICG